jgi:hypothetical protein
LNFSLGVPVFFQASTWREKQMSSKRGILLLCLIFFLCMTLIPLAGLGGSSGSASGGGFGSKNGSNSSGTSVSLPPSTKQFRIRDTATGNIINR